MQHGRGGRMPHGVPGVNPYAGLYGGYDTAAYAAQQYANAAAAGTGAAPPQYNMYAQQFAGYNPYFGAK